MKRRPPQNGAALLMLMMSLIIAGLGFLLINQLNPDARQRAQDEASDAALATAKAALIGYAASAAMTKTSVGDLLCPDLNDDGIAYSTGNGCAGAANQGLRLGRMPWRTLGLPEMRDGSAERLWYAVSDNFRSFQPAVSNSDTAGTITVRDAAGNIVYDSSTGNGVAAVIIAPGSPLATPRLQRRPSNNAADYLDLALGEDNASFQDGTTDGFILGPVRSNSGQIISNDRMVVITRDELLAATEKRIAAEVRNCLIAWATINSDQFPFPAPIESTDTRSVSGTLFGRVPLKFPRNPSESIALAISKLDAARTLLIASTSQSQPAAMLAINRANASLIQATSGLAATATSMIPLTGTTLAAQIDANALDPLVTANGQTSPASALTNDPNMVTALSATFSTLVSNANATNVAAARLQQTTAMTISKLTTYIDDTLTPARNIQLANRSVLINMNWSDTPTCTWLDPDRKDSKGKLDPSGWVSNQWIKHLYYQIDQRSLVRSSSGDLAPGALTINDRTGYQLIVIAAGRALKTQTRATTDPAQFFEGNNAHVSRSGGAIAPSKTFEQRPVSDTFNDQLAY